MISALQVPFFDSGITVQKTCWPKNVFSRIDLRASKGNLMIGKMFPPDQTEPGKSLFSGIARLGPRIKKELKGIPQGLMLYQGQAFWGELKQKPTKRRAAWTKGAVQ